MSWLGSSLARKGALLLLLLLVSACASYPPNPPLVQVDPKQGYPLKGGLRRIVVLLVDARTRPSHHLDRKDRAPGLVSSLSASASIPLRNFSTESAELLRKSFAEAQRSQDKAIDLYFIHLRLEALPEGEEQDRLLAIPTTLQLSEEDADLLISAAPKLLAESAELRRLLDDLGAVWDRDVQSPGSKAGGT